MSAYGNGAIERAPGPTITAGKALVEQVDVAGARDDAPVRAAEMLNDLAVLAMRYDDPDEAAELLRALVSLHADDAASAANLAALESATSVHRRPD